MTDRQIRINDTLSVGWSVGQRPCVYVERRDAGLVRVALDEVQGLREALAEAAARSLAEASGQDYVSPDDLF